MQGFEVSFIASSDYGATFGDVIHPNDDPTKGDSYPEIATSDGRVYLLWEGGGIYLKSSDDGGANFGPRRTVLGEFPGGTGFAEMDASGGHVYVTWPDDRANADEEFDILYSTSADHGTTFSTPEKLADHSGPLWVPFPKVAASREDVYVVWSTSASGSFSRHSHDFGVTFEAPINQTSEFGAFFPSIVAENDRLFFAWSPFGITELFFAGVRNDYEIINDTELIVENRTGISNLDLAASNGNVYLTWFDSTEGNHEIFLWRRQIPLPIRVLYLYPNDKNYQPCYESALEKAALNAQIWFGDEMDSDKTFALSDPIVEVHQTPHDATYYASSPNGKTFLDSVLEDVMALTGVEVDDPNYTGAVYIDADPKCGQSNSGAFEGLAILPANDLRGLAGQFNRPICPEDVPDDRGPCRWVGGFAKFLGHAFGLPRSANCPASMTNCGPLALTINGFLDIHQQASCQTSRKYSMRVHSFMRYRPRWTAFHALRSEVIAQRKISPSASSRSRLFTKRADW